jgi:hypothetical protein
MGDPIGAVKRMFTPPGTGGVEAAQQQANALINAPPGSASPLAPPPAPAGPPGLAGGSTSAPSASTFIGTNLPVRPPFTPGSAGASSTQRKSLLGQ